MSEHHHHHSGFFYEWLPLFAVILVGITLAVALAGCASEPETTRIVATTVDVPSPPMASACHADAYEKFVGVKKVAGDKTPVDAPLTALEIDKRRMGSNADRVQNCECSIADQSKNPDDVKRLSGKCGVPRGMPVSKPTT